jgi:hypothetical protein
MEDKKQAETGTEKKEKKRKSKGKKESLLPMVVVVSFDGIPIFQQNDSCLIFICLIYILSIHIFFIYNKTKI